MAQLIGNTPDSGAEEMNGIAVCFESDEVAVWVGKEGLEIVLGGRGGMMISPNLGGTITLVQLHFGGISACGPTGWGGSLTEILEEILFWGSIIITVEVFLVLLVTERFVLLLITSIYGLSIGFSSGSYAFLKPIGVKGSAKGLSSK